MKNILFSLFLLTAPLLAEELEIIESIPLDDMSTLQAEYTNIEPVIMMNDDVVENSPKMGLNGLGNLHENSETKKSYLKGILNGQEYGQYALNSLYSTSLVKNLYRKRDYKTFWISSDFDLNANLFDLLQVLSSAENEGLDGNKYHYPEITAIMDELKHNMLLSQKDKNLAITQVDVLLSDAFFTIAKDLHEGELDFTRFHNTLRQKSEEEEIHYNWENPKRKMNYSKFLTKATNSTNLEVALLSLATTNTMYQGMKEAYISYKSIEQQGGWKKIPRGGKLKVGSISQNRVPLLAERLTMTGDLSFYDPEGIVMTEEMKEGLKHYQRRMGIWPSGQLTDITRNALNVSVTKRLKKIKLNLERMRWESDAFSSAHILINIPAFQMQFIRDGVKDVEMRVVVGKKENPTPVFNSTLSYIVLNPTWSVPKSIVKKEMLPRIQEDPDYFATRKFKLYRGWDKNREEVDGFDVDWWQYDENSNIPYSFVREAGAGNPLGNVKFMFPNKYAVYMHDTPQKKLFKNSKRAYSHGCIRLHKPQELLEYMSNNYSNSEYERVKRMQDSGKSQSLRLNQKIPVHIRYYTSWVEADTGVQFRGDIYGYDKIQYQHLAK